MFERSWVTYALRMLVLQRAWRAAGLDPVPVIRLDEPEPEPNFLQATVRCISRINDSAETPNLPGRLS